MDYDRTLEDVVETVRNAPGRDVKCTLLIGAGCSVKAGVPLASEFVDIIRDEFPQAYRRAEVKGKVTYAACMAQLLRGERRELISS